MIIPYDFALLIYIAVWAVCWVCLTEAVLISHSIKTKPCSPHEYQLKAVCSKCGKEMKP